MNGCWSRDNKNVNLDGVVGTNAADLSMVRVICIILSDER